MVDSSSKLEEKLMYKCIRNLFNTLININDFMLFSLVIIVGDQGVGKTKILKK